MGPYGPAEDAALAERLGVSRAAVELTRKCELVDLHIDTFIPHRIYRYDLKRRHGRWPFFGWFYQHLDFPRIREGGMTAAMWSITTNPFRTAAGRWRTFLSNVERMKALMDTSQGGFRLVRTYAEFRAARAAGAHAAIPAIQGGNALVGAPEGPQSIPERFIARVTLVHLTNSAYGVTSSPLAFGRRGEGLTRAGCELVERLDAARIFVDLAHINPAGFWDAARIHDPSLPLIVTHTGVTGVRPHWRNIDDDQIRAIARTGGTIGIIFSEQFLASKEGPRNGQMVVDHMEHIIRVVGDDFVSVGSDFDGNIIPPHDLRSGDAYPRLVQHMLDRKFDEQRIQKILGGNFLRAFEALRPN